jgi:two-component system, OmpR family, KDP operon response regulator KdpE
MVAELDVNSASILLVDDEPQIRRVLRATLHTAGYHVLDAKNGEKAIEAVIRDHPDLVLLDVNMPDMTGLELCSKLRQSFEGPIIMVSVRSSARDKMAAFNLGADDYLVKPFSVDELLARIKVALRRSNFGQAPLRIGSAELNIDFERRMVVFRGKLIHLTPKEFEVLRTLALREGKVVPYRRILQLVWGPDYRDEFEKVRGVIKEIRKKIEPDPEHPRYVITEAWFGYKFQVPNEGNGSRRKQA